MQQDMMNRLQHGMSFMKYVKQQQIRMILYMDFPCVQLEMKKVPSSLFPGYIQPVVL